jgi:hypothetical protein
MRVILPAAFAVAQLCFALDRPAMSQADPPPLTAT